VNFRQNCKGNRNQCLSSVSHSRAVHLDVVKVFYLLNNAQ